jgi:hypothetical protein
VDDSDVDADAAAIKLGVDAPSQPGSIDLERGGET